MLQLGGLRHLNDFVRSRSDLSLTNLFKVFVSLFFSKENFSLMLTVHVFQYVLVVISVRLHCEGIAGFANFHV